MLKAFLVASLVALSPLVAQAAEQVSRPIGEPIVPSSGDLATQIPESGKGANRVFVQLVWDGKAGKLERRRFEIFDPFAASNFRLSWQPRRVTPEEAGPISGQGIVTWFRPETSGNGRDAAVAQYRGHIEHGRPEGSGIFVHVSGIRYDGAWKNGLMHGKGELRLANGDVYTGGFSAGQMHGQGLFITAAGDVYEGGYATGRRNGPGNVLQANGLIYASVWHDGTEDFGKRGKVTAQWLKMAASEASASDDFAVTLAVGPGPKKEDPSFCCLGGPPVLAYTSKSSPERLDIYPDAPGLLDVWRGKANIAIQDTVAFDWDRYAMEQYSLLNYTSGHITPMFLLVGLENRTNRDTRIVGTYLDVSESELDAEPALQSTELKPLAAQSIIFSIENYGWAAAEDASLQFAFVKPDGQRSREFTIPVGKVEDVGQFSFEKPLNEMGVASKDIEDLKTICINAENTCLEKLRALGTLGELASYVTKKWGFGVNVAGKFHYSWKNADKGGTVDAPFEAYVPLGAFYDGAECEGSSIPDLTEVPLSLQPEGKDYRINLGFEATLARGAVSRWRLPIDAPKTSNHKFRVVFQLADGSEIKSREIDLLYFKPRNFPASLRPFEPRC